MKKYITFIIAAVMLILAACDPTHQPQENTTTPTTTAPSTTTTPTETTKPVETTQPTETTVPPTTAAPTETTAPPTEPTETEPDPSVPGSYGMAFVYDGSDPTFGTEPDFSECILGHFYYVDLNTANVFLVTDAAVTVYNSSNTHIFYVKEAEPNKIYAVPLADLTQHTAIFESDLGEIAPYLYPGPESYYNTVIQFVEGNKRLVWLDISSGTAEILLEQYYIMKAYVDTDESDFTDGEDFLKDTNVIFFVGKFSADDELEQYLYYRDTGEIKICTYL